MTPGASRDARDARFRAVVVDGGALGAVAIDVASRAVLAGHAHGDLVTPAVLDLLLGAVRPAGPLTRACGGPPVSTARELFVAGSARALYAVVLDHGEIIVIATPAAMSVALGWALVRGLAAPWSER
jgi:hypothetical protein